MKAHLLKFILFSCSILVWSNIVHGQPGDEEMIRKFINEYSKSLSGVYQHQSSEDLLKYFSDDFVFNSVYHNINGEISVISGSTEKTT